MPKCLFWGRRIIYAALAPSFFHSPFFAQKPSLPTYRCIFTLTTQFSKAKPEKPFHVFSNCVTRSLHFKYYQTPGANLFPNVYTLAGTKLQ